MSPQASIAHYRITAKLGEGGMGEVWRATDTKLNREVAIKVLPASFAGDPAHMARFEREAKALASLNHPHIAQIFGIEEGATSWSWWKGSPSKVRCRSRRPSNTGNRSSMPWTLPIRKASSIAI
jgi:serine/threonine protein kinase